MIEAIKACCCSLVENAEKYVEADKAERVKIKIEIWKGQTSKIIIEQYAKPNCPNSYHGGDV